MTSVVSSPQKVEGIRAFYLILSHIKEIGLEPSLIGVLLGMVSDTGFG